MLNLKKEVYTTKHVIEAVGISRLTLYRWIASGKIPEVPKDYKNHRIFTQKDIQRIMQFKSQVKQPQVKKKDVSKKWSAKFLALPGNWKDARPLQKIVDDIYSLRNDKEIREVRFS